MKKFVLCKSNLSLLLVIFLSGFLQSSSAQITVRGTVLRSDNNLPAEGVTVNLAGLNAGTVTNADGQFRLGKVPPDGKLIFSAIGYKTEEIEVSGRTEINVTLTTTMAKLNEVVVVGYGTQRVKDITGSISSIQAKALREVPVVQVPQMLQGRAAGVYVVSDGNKPGAGATVRIRGNRSFSASNSPLFVIDGIPNAGGLEDINPNDIESIEILKDASSTAIYGSQGANGVVLVTTKRGKAGEVIVDYSGYAGYSKAYRKANIFNGAEYAEYKRESFRATGSYDDNNPDADKAILTPLEIANLAAGVSTDWQELMLRNGFKQNHQLGVHGGSEKTRVSLSFNYFKDNGIVPTQDFTRYSIRLNLDQQLGRRIKIGTSTLASHTITNGRDLNPYNQTLLESPLVTPYDSSGKLIFKLTDDALRSNPLSDIEPNARINRDKRMHIVSAIFGELQILDGLKYRVNFGPDWYQTTTGNFNGSLTNTRMGGAPNAGNIVGTTFTYTLENILTYSRTFSAKHSLNVTALQSMQERRMENSTINVLGVPVEEMHYHNMGAADQITGVSSTMEKWGILSYMGRVNYGFDNRYLITLTGRMDGSSRFGANNKYGFFPSVAFAWNVIDEPFFHENIFFDNLKLRLSYGKTGNTGVSPYGTQGLLARTVYAFGDAGAFGYRPSQIRNDELRWESTTTFNAGIDFTIFRGALSGTVEYYRQNTTDLLMLRQLPFTSGFGSVLENVGATRNSGFEVTLSSINISNPNNPKAFAWTTDLNFATNKEEIVSLYGGKEDDIGNLWFIGQPLSVFYDYQKVGIWQTNEKDQAASMGFVPGEIKVKDLDGNGAINSSDRIIIGTDRPSLSGGLTNRISFMNFELSAFLFARFGTTINSPFHRSINILHGRWNNMRVDYWTPSNPTNAYPRPNRNQEGAKNGSTLAYFDGSFVKLRNVTLSYNFEQQVARKIGARSLRVYFTAEQPYMWSPYVQKHNGIDPEYIVIDTPALSAYVIGVNASF